MPWKVIKRDCKKADGTSGSYVVLKEKGSGSTEQSSCHDTKEKAQGSVAARKMSEGRKMKITKRQLRRLIREAVLRETWAGTPTSVREWETWGETFSLTPEYDNDGQLTFYLSQDQPDRAAIAAEAIKAGANVDNDVIYTGMTDMGPMYTDEDHAAAEEILNTRMGSYSGTTLPGGKRIK